MYVCEFEDNVQYSDCNSNNILKSASFVLNNQSHEEIMCIKCTLQYGQCTT